jgi:predicted dehydrogenase
LQLGFQRRFDPAYVAAKRRIDAGDIGRLHGLHERQHPAGHRAGSTGA